MVKSSRILCFPLRYDEQIYSRHRSDTAAVLPSHVLSCDDVVPFATAAAAAAFPGFRVIAAALKGDGKLDRANILTGRTRRRRSVDYVKLNEAVFGYVDACTEPNVPSLSLDSGSLRKGCVVSYVQ